MFESKHRSGALRLAGIGAALFIGPLSPGLMGCGISYEFEPATVGDDQAGRAPEPRTNSQFIRAVYIDILGRAPEVYDFSIEDGQGKELIKFPIQEQVNLVGALDSTGDPDALRAIVTAGLLGSAEVDLPSKSSVDDPRAFIRDKFRALLGREPNTYEAFAFEDAWKNDAAAGPRTVIRAIVGSREYQSR
jgi:hypothetical protein